MHVRGTFARSPLTSIWKTCGSFPIIADPSLGHSLHLFRKVAFVPVIEGLASTSVGVGKMVSALFRLRTWLGDVLNWDDHDEPLAIPGCAEASVRERLNPQALQQHRSDLEIRRTGRGTAEVYVFEEEVLEEISNRTIHALIHLGWVCDDERHCRVQLAVYVKDRGLLSQAYMLLIRPFRYVLVYPYLLQRVGQAWDEALSESNRVDSRRRRHS